MSKCITAALPSARDPALGKVSFSNLCRVLDLGARQRRLFLARAGTDVCRVFTRRTLGKDVYAECCCSALGKIYLFFFFSPPNVFCCGPTLLWTTYAIWTHYSNCLLYLFNLFHLIEFLVIIQIWTASQSKNWKKWIEKWFSYYWAYVDTLSMNGSEISKIMFTTHNHKLGVQLFLNCIKSKFGQKIMKLVEMSWYHMLRLW